MSRQVRMANRNHFLMQFRLLVCLGLAAVISVDFFALTMISRKDKAILNRSLRSEPLLRANNSRSDDMNETLSSENLDGLLHGKEHTAEAAAQESKVVTELDRDRGTAKSDKRDDGTETSPKSSRKYSSELRKDNKNEEETIAAEATAKASARAPTTPAKEWTEVEQKQTDSARTADVSAKTSEEKDLTGEERDIASTTKEQKKHTKESKDSISKTEDPEAEVLEKEDSPRPEKESTVVKHSKKEKEAAVPAKESSVGGPKESKDDDGHSAPEKESTVVQDSEKEKASAGVAHELPFDGSKESKEKTEENSAPEKESSIVKDSEKEKESAGAANESPVHGSEESKEKSGDDSNGKEGRPSLVDDNLSIMKYMERSDHRDWRDLTGHLGLLKWDSSGALEIDTMNKTISNMMFKQWFQMEWFPNGEASEFGKVALLLNTDCVGFLKWDEPRPIPLLTWSSPLNVGREDNVWLLPNPYDLMDFNRYCIEEVKRVTTSFDRRLNKIVWRGTVHNDQETSRTKLLEIAGDRANSHWLDAASASAAGEMGKKEQAEFRYQIDMGGVSGTTWGALRWKMCSGSLVFKVDSWAKDWWHDMIEPWKHYIPVKEDLSDLYELWQWAETHPEEASQIAKAGEAKCDETSTESFVKNYMQDMLAKLPAATKAQAEEANAILKGQTGPNKLISRMKKD